VSATIDAAVVDFNRTVAEQQRRALTRAMEALESERPSTEQLGRAQGLKGYLDAAHEWSDTNPAAAEGFFSTFMFGAFGPGLVIRMAGGWDTKRNLYSRLAALRSATMSVIGRSATGLPVATQAPATVADQLTGAVLYGDGSAAGSAGLARTATKAAAEIPADVAAEAGRRAEQLGGAAAAAAPYLPWIGAAVGAVVLLGLFLRVRG
jgi:hypothetical protein